MITCPTAQAQTESGDTPVAEMRTTARTSDGHYISWREHIIDDTASAGIPISGSDGLVMADLDGDGFEDIVSVHESDTTYDGVADGHIRIAFGSGNPSVWTNVTLAQGAEAGAAEDAAIGDVNGDGLPDIIAACELAHLIYFQNPGDGVRTGNWPRVIPSITRDRGSFIRVFLADLNGDGRLEAVAPNKGEQNPDRDTKQRNPISIFEIKGDPLVDESWVEHELGRYRIPQNARPVDLDGDGDTDIVGGARVESEVFWFENQGEGDFSFEEHTIEIDGARSGGFNMAFEDLNHDGRLDVVLATDHGFAWIEQPVSPASVWNHHRMGAFGPDTITGFAVADINGDGHADVIAGSYSRGPREHDGDVTRADPLGRIAWFENPGDPTQPWTRHDVSRRKRGMFDKFIARDMDQDGDIDFIGTRGNSEPYDGVFWLEQVRTEIPRPNFQPARQNDSQEMPLP